jgi:hypothetical protein
MVPGHQIALRIVEPESCAKKQDIEAWVKSNLIS